MDVATDNSSSLACCEFGCFIVDIGGLVVTASAACNDFTISVNSSKNANCSP